MITLQPTPLRTVLLFSLTLVVAAALGVATPALAAKGGGGGGGKPAKTYSVGGNLAGLQTGDTVTLLNNGADALSVDADGSFTFGTTLPQDATYEVTVSSASAGVTCEVSNGSGTITRSNINNVSVTCSNSGPDPTYSVSGTVSGLSGSVTLQNNGGDNLVRATNGDFSFATELASGAAYNVTVAVAPTGQTCAVDNGAGNISDADITNVSVTCQTTSVSATRLEGAGDSIMRGYNASCTGNTGFFDLFCYSGGDQNQNSFHDGSSSGVNSLLDRYLAQTAGFSGGKSASASGSEMTDPGKNNFAAQAAAIVAASSQPLITVVELGGNDLCNRSSGADLYSDTQWQSAVDAGLQTLVNGLPDGSTVYLSSVPRVQDLRRVGLAKQASTSGVNCENFWQSFDVCSIATSSDTFFSQLDERQQAYNMILAERASYFNGLAGSTGVEVIAESQAAIDDPSRETVGNFAFTPAEMNGGDCFHPSVAGQNKLSQILWSNRPGN
jgi:hypothetical protein